MEEISSEEEVQLIDIWKFFLKNIWSLLIMGVLGGILAAGYVMLFVEPIYQSQVQLLVNQGIQSEEIQLNQIQANERLINTYEDIVLANSTLQIVSERLNEEISPSVIKNSLSITQQSDSQAFNINATADSPEKAQKLIATVSEVFQDQVMTAYSTNNPNIFVLSDATFNENPISPNIILSTLIGIIIGGIIGLAYFFIKEISDKSIYNPEYVENIGLIKLGEISDITDSLREDSRLGSKTKRSRRRI